MSRSQALKRSVGPLMYKHEKHSLQLISMILLQSTAIDLASYITHPISLVAYVCALILYYFVSKNINDRKKLKDNPDAYVKTAERLGLDLDKIPEGPRADLVMRVLKNRITSQLITAASLIIGGLIISYLFVNYIDGDDQPNPIDTDGTSEQIILYNDADFTGICMKTTSDWSVQSSRDDCNDKISAIYIPVGWKVIAYSHIGFTGDSIILSKSWDATENPTWNDAISSIRVQKKN